MDKIIISLGYIHPETRILHCKDFTDIVSARIALTSLAKRNIPVVYGDFRNNSRRIGFYGTSDEQFIDAFIQCGGEYNIDYSYKDKLIPELIWDWIQTRTVNDIVTINGRTYTVEEDCFKQDEMWAEAYNSYSGYDKVWRWTVTSATDEEVYVEFYTDL